MRAHIEAIPDGTYTFQEHIDSDGVDWAALTIDLQLTIDGSSVHVDLSNSSPPCRGPLNSVLSTTMAGVFIGFKHVFPDVPINAGCFRPFTFDIPTTTFLNAQEPRPVSGCAAEVCQRMIDVILGALGQALPEKAYAGPMGTVTNLAVGGNDPLRGYYVFYSFIGGGYGGNHLTDGLINGNPTLAVARTQALEISNRTIRFSSGNMQSVKTQEARDYAEAVWESYSSSSFDEATPRHLCWATGDVFNPSACSAASPRGRRVIRSCSVAASTHRNI